MSLFTELKHARRHSHGASFTGDGFIRALLAFRVNRILILASPARKPHDMSIAWRTE